MLSGGRRTAFGHTPGHTVRPPFRYEYCRSAEVRLGVTLSLLRLDPPQCQRAATRSMDNPVGVIHRKNDRFKKFEEVPDQATDSAKTLE